MRARTKKILIGFAAVVVLYFGLYFASVRIELGDPRLAKAVLVPYPVYRPFDGSFVHAVFAPAYLIDAAFCRRARWEPRNLHEHTTAS